MIVLAGGSDLSETLDSVEVFSLAKWEWEYGPSLPGHIAFAETVQVCQGNVLCSCCCC